MRSPDLGSAVPAAPVADLVDRLHYEIVPTASVDDAIADLPPAATVAVTCSPSRGIDATRRIAERLVALGHHAIPHLSARLVDDRAEVSRLARWLRGSGCREVFVIAGDVPRAAGRYEGASPFVADLLEADPGVMRLGVAGYPEGHPFLHRDEAAERLRATCDLLAAASMDGWVTTQMCFDADAVLDWTRRLRAIGVALPVHPGVPGIVDRGRLLRLSARLGVGASVRYLRKNHSAVRLLARRHDPTPFVLAVADHAGSLGIEALHAFTFNAVADTRAWHDALRSTRAAARSRR